jgi:predicted Zn finger-like uncharacterized protein
MDVRCEKCKTEYEFDEARITEAGVTVKCTTCGHVFRVKKKTLAVTMPVSSLETTPSGNRPREWKLRQPSGSVVSFKELTTLQKWIVERKASRDDEISITGESWKPLGSIVELAPFFQIVEEADAARAYADRTAEVPTPESPTGRSPLRDVGRIPVMDPMPPRGGTQPEFRVKRSGSGPLVTVLLLLGLLGMGGYFGYVYWWEPREREARLNAEAEAAAKKAKAQAEKDAAAAAALPPPVVDAGVVEAVAPPPPPPEPEPVVVDAGPPPAPMKAKAAVIKDYDYYLRRAEVLREKGRNDQAMDMYGQAADLEPTRAEPVAGRGLVFLDQGKHLQAEASFKQALKLNPRYGVALIGLAETYRSQAKNEEAVAQYERYLEVLPNGPEANVARNALSKLK